jgi:hypothetical protein
MTAVAEKNLDRIFDVGGLPIFEEVMVWLKKMSISNSPPKEMDTTLTNDQFKKPVKLCVTKMLSSSSGFSSVIWRLFELSPLSQYFYSQMMYLNFQHNFSTNR